MTQEIITNQACVSVYTDTFNKRIRVDDYSGNLEKVIEIIDQQIEVWVEKLIVKSRVGDVPFFISKGFFCEAFVKGYFSGADMYFVTRYHSAERERRTNWELEQSIVNTLIKEKNQLVIPAIDNIKEATVSRSADLAGLYRRIFKVYPTPLSDEEYLRKTMNEGTLYAYIEENNQIVSAASAEINRKYKNAELTDCATLPQAEGKGHMKKLLYFIDRRLKAEDILCCYSIARAESFSMNKAFAQLGYSYGGRLIKNCIIYSGLEDMNVWYKSSPA